MEKQRSGILLSWTNSIAHMMVSFGLSETHCWHALLSIAIATVQQMLLQFINIVNVQLVDMLVDDVQIL